MFCYFTITTPKQSHMLKCHFIEYLIQTWQRSLSTLYPPCVTATEKFVTLTQHVSRLTDTVTTHNFVTGDKTLSPVTARSKFAKRVH